MATDGDTTSLRWAFSPANFHGGESEALMSSNAATQI